MCYNNIVKGKKKRSINFFPDRIGDIYNMKRYTKKQLREIVRCGYAEDITETEWETVKDIASNSEKIAYTLGVYGISGVMLLDRRNGKRYAIIGRSSNLFRVL